MTTQYSEIIDRLRGEVGDYPEKMFETADADGSSTLFRVAQPKIKESSYVVKVNNVVQTEGVNYQLDPDTGDFIFGSGSIPAQGDDNVAFSYSSVRERDNDWIRIINSVLSRLHKKLWVEAVDESLVTNSNSTKYDLTTIADDILYIISVEYRTSASSEWQNLRGVVNCFFLRESQQLYVDPKFPTSGYEIRLRYLRAYDHGTSIGSTFEVQEKYWPIIMDFAKAEYYRRRAGEAMRQTSALSKEKTFEDAQTLLRLAREIENQGLEKLKQSRPPKPAVVIPFRIG